MAQLTFPIAPAGLVAAVLVNLEASLLLPLRASGGGPEPFQTRGLVDTAGDLSAVALPILPQLGSPPSGKLSCHGRPPSRRATVTPINRTSPAG